MTDLIPRAVAAKLGRLHARFEAELDRPREYSGSRADALIRGRIRYIQILARRVCADARIEEPDWANSDFDSMPGASGGDSRGMVGSPGLQIQRGER